MTSERIEFVAKQATIYFAGTFGVQKIEAHDVEVAVGPWAQYDAAVHVKYTPRGKRKARGFVQSYAPSLVVLDGWGHADPSSGFERDGRGNGISRYRSFDGRYQAEFAEILAAYLAASGAKVLGDYRAHSPYGRRAA